MWLTTDTDDAESKRWLIVAVIACLVCGAWVAHGVFRALNPAEIAQEPPPPPSAPIALVEHSELAEWSSPVPPESHEMYTPIPTAVIERVVSPEVARAEFVHRHAAWLRQMANDPKGRNAIGNLTPQQIDEMETNGITIN